MSYQKKQEVGKLLKAPGQGTSEPFYQVEESVEEDNIEVPA